NRGSGGSVTFQARILPTVTGTQVTNTATITSGQTEAAATLADNTTQWITNITSGILSTSLAVAPASGATGETTTLTATLTSGGSPVAGKAIDFYLNGTFVGTSL